MSEANDGGMAVEVEPSHQYFTVLLCDRWQQRGSLTKWCLTWKYVWSKGVSLDSSMLKKWHPLAFIDACWMSMETKQWVWAQWGGGWCISTVVTAMWKTSRVLDSLAQHKMKSISVSHSVTTMNWNQNDCPYSGDMNSEPSVGKVMCTVFWDRKEVIFLDLLEPGQIFNWLLHCSAD